MKHCYICKKSVEGGEPYAKLNIAWDCGNHGTYQSHMVCDGCRVSLRKAINDVIYNEKMRRIAETNAKEAEDRKNEGN